MNTETPKSLYAIKPFRNREEAHEYIRFQGWKNGKARARMFHWPDHPWANRVGNVCVVRIDTGVSGYQYVFTNGEILPKSYHGQINYQFK